MSAVAAMREWAARPSVFVRQVLGATPDAWQDEVLEAIVTYDRIALKASKGPGKSTLLSWLAWWFLATRPHPKVVATSITEDNLRDGLWSEMAKWMKGAPLLQREFTWNAERIIHDRHPETWWMSARNWPKSADMNAQADTLAGVHADHVMFIGDEAGGLPDAVMAAAEGGLANAGEEGREAKLLIAGNPTLLSGPLYRACTRERALWWVKEISGDPDDPKRAPRVSVEWAREQIAKYGRDNPWVLVNVFGQFPPGQSNALLGVEEVTAASLRLLEPRLYLEETKILGVDVARFGDDRSTLTKRQGLQAFKAQVWRNLDTGQLAAEICKVIDAENPDATFLDQAGVGAGVLDRCRELRHSVIGVDFGGGAMDSKRYANKRAEMWDATAAWIRRGGCIADDAELVSELTAPTYKFRPNQQMVLESKEDLKKRGLPSPDKADGLVLTFAFPVAHRTALEKLLASPEQRRIDNDFDPYQERP